MIKNIEKGALLNLKMLMAGAYSASRSSQSSHCCSCISPTILAILAKVQWQAGKDGKGLQYISAKVNNLDEAAITIINKLDNTEASEELENLLEINLECCSPQHCSVLRCYAFCVLG